MMKSSGIAVLLLMVMGSWQAANADILSLYEFSVDNLADGLGNEISNSSDGNVSSFSSDYSTRSAAIGASETGIAPGLHGFMSAGDTPNNTNPTVNGYFHEFTTTIVDGEWNLDAITFDYFINSSPVGGEFTVSVFSDRTGVSSSADSLGSFTINTLGGDTGVIAASVDISGAADLQGLTAGDSTTFRLQFSDNQFIGFVHRFDNVALDATSAIPEPASAALLCFASVGLIVRRRKA